MFPFSRFSHKEGFTLIELLVVIAIIAILSIVVILTLNPAELLRQSRDANRVSDMATLNSALGIYQTDQGNAGSLGSSSAVYISLPDTTSTCTNLGLPAVPAGYSYTCSSSTSSRNIDGTGWIPVNFRAISSGAPIGSLPIDPTNAALSGLYYTYAASTTQYMVTATPESQKQKLALSQQPIVPNYPGVIAQGSNLSISPLYSQSGLMGYWPFEEGGGASAKDISNNGNTAAWNGSAIGNGGTYYSTGKIGSYAGILDGSTTYLNIASSTLNFSANSPFTAMIWVNFSSPLVGRQSIMGNSNGVCGFFFGEGWLATGDLSLFIETATTTYEPRVLNTVTTGQWEHIAGVFDGNVATLYFNGAAVATTTGNYTQCASNQFRIALANQGGWIRTFGQIDDSRVYNRALSAAEVQAIYNAGK